MTQHQAKQNDPHSLSQQFKPPSKKRYEFTIDRFERLIKFYTEKSDTVPTRVRYYFGTLITSLQYAMEIMGKYKDLTTRLASTAKEQDDETRTSSKSR